MAKDIEKINTGGEEPVDLGLSELQVPEDIRIGLEKAYGEIPGMIERGEVDYLDTKIASLLELLARSLDSKLEFTGQSKDQLQKRLESLLQQGLNKGVAHILKSLEASTRRGTTLGISNRRRQLLRIADVAKKYNISLDIVPTQEGTADDRSLMTTVRTQEVVNRCVDEVVGNNILIGIVTRIRELGNLFGLR